MEDRRPVSVDRPDSVWIEMKDEEEKVRD